MRPDNTLPMFGESDAFEIERIYLTRHAKGRGIGKAMMLRAIAIAEEMGRDLIWLKVMDGNFASIKFYESFGFKRFAPVTLDLPNLRPEHAGMFVMRRSL